MLYLNLLSIKLSNFLLLHWVLHHNFLFHGEFFFILFFFSICLLIIQFDRFTITSIKNRIAKAQTKKKENQINNLEMLMVEKIGNFYDDFEGLFHINCLRVHGKGRFICKQHVIKSKLLFIESCLKIIGGYNNVAVNECMNRLKKLLN